MRIVKFVGKSIYGFLNFNIPFREDMTFLTGINGTGKTTIAKCIYWLLAPSIRDLCVTSYSRLEVTVKYNDEDLVIRARKSRNKLSFSIEGIKKALTVPLISEQDSLFSDTGRDEAFDYYSEVVLANSDHPVLKRLDRLPTPMFLGLERRGLDRAFRRVRRPVRVASRRAEPSIFSATLVEGLREAVSIAEGTFREVSVKQRKLDEKLRNEILLSAISYISSGEPGLASHLRKDFFDEKALKRSMQLMKGTLVRLGLHEAELERELTPLEERVAWISHHIKKPDLSKKEIDRIIESDDKEKMSAFIEWTMQNPHFGRINKILSHIRTYLKESKKINEEIVEYLKTLNKFLNDSDKEIYFNEQGFLRVKTKSEGSASVMTLSSGESQIFVIITHVAFNPSATLANVLIIDEPELSLHVRWQELFVDSIRETNPSIQLVLATHSPSIILDKIDYCVDLDLVKT